MREFKWNLSEIYVCYILWNASLIVRYTCMDEIYEVAIQVIGCCYLMRFVYTWMNTVTVTVTGNVYTVTGDSDRKCLYRWLDDVIWYDLCIWLNSVIEYWSWCDDVYGMMFIEKTHIIILLMYEYIVWYVCCMISLTERWSVYLTELWAHTPTVLLSAGF